MPCPTLVLLPVISQQLFPAYLGDSCFWVLKTMCISSLLLRITKSLHLPSNARICVRNLLFMLIEIANGVKQGDPSAMVLFIIAYEPLIRFIDAALQSVDHLLLPYCDDLAIACTDIVNAWKIILRCFRAIKKMCSLSLNLDKTQFLLTSKPQSRMIKIRL